jgi:hypothetical protein
MRMFEPLESRAAREARHRAEWDEAVAGLAADQTGLLGFLVAHTSPSTRVYSWSVETVASYMGARPDARSGPVGARALAVVERAADECNRWCTSRGGVVNVFEHGGRWYAGLEVRRPHYDEDNIAGSNLTV